MYMSVLTECLYMHHGMLGAYRSQKESVGSPGTRATDDWVVMWVLGIEPMSSARASCATNCWAISLVPNSGFLHKLINTKIMKINGLLEMRNRP